MLTSGEDREKAPARRSYVAIAPAPTWGVGGGVGNCSLTGVGFETRRAMAVDFDRNGLLTSGVAFAEWSAARRLPRLLLLADGRSGEVSLCEPQLPRERRPEKSGMVTPERSDAVRVRGVSLDVGEDTAGSEGKGKCERR